MESKYRMLRLVSFQNFTHEKKRKIFAFIFKVLNCYRVLYL